MPVIDTQKRVTERPSRQFGLRALLLGVMIAGVFVGMYTRVWLISHIVPALFTMIVAAALIMTIQRKRRKNELLGAVAGGACGGILSIALHKICCNVLIPGLYEHEGLDLFEFTLMFSPLGAICGVFVGAFTWALARLFTELREMDAHMRE